MRRRLTLVALIAAASAFALLTWTANSPLGASAPQKPGVSNGVLSTNRIQPVLNDVASDVMVRNIAKAAAVGGQSCIAINRGGRSVLSQNSDKSLIPASTLKLITATAALNLYGAEGKFTTTVKAAHQDNGIVNGPIYLVGGGDPLLFTAAYAGALRYNSDVHTSLETLADQVAAKGVRTIHGSVIGDDSRFDQVRYLPSWDPGYQSQGQIGPTGGLQVNQGFEKFVGGRVPAVSPTLDATAVLTDLLKQRGIKVDGQPASGMTPDKASTVASVDSAPVSAIVSEMLTESDNSTAEMMLRNIGVKASGAGTFAAGLDATKSIAAKSGIPMAGIVMIDGSGLDRSDRATCAALLGALTHDGPKGVIAAGLPKAGQTGTLAQRMGGGPAVGKVAAKTGTLSGVSALAGWIDPNSADPMAFAVVNNGITSDQGRRFEDGLAESLAALPAS